MQSLSSITRIRAFTTCFFNPLGIFIPSGMRIPFFFGDTLCLEFQNNIVTVYALMPI